MGRGTSKGGAADMKRFLKMTRGEAVTSLVHYAEDLNEAEDPRMVEKVFDRAIQWSNSNTDQMEIECYELSDDGFNDGNTYGIGIEDDYIVFKEYREAWKEYSNRF